MVIQRGYARFELGKQEEVRELFREWREAYPFPANSVRFMINSFGAPPSTLVFELVFDSLGHLEQGWEAWNANNEEMAPFYERWVELLVEPVRHEIWRAF